MTKDKPVCATWNDHDFLSPRLVDGGRDVLRGPYLVYRQQCRKCGKFFTETRWTHERALLNREERP